MDVWNFVANKTEDVSVGGHIGGAIVGLTLGLFIMENFFVSRCDNVMKYLGLGKFTDPAVGIDRVKAGLKFF